MDETEAETQDMGMPRSPFPERRLPGPPEDLPMDVGLLKVLASDSRRDILQLLRKRRMTLTELSHALDLKKATVLEHLKKLTEAGLIKRIEDERLWVYYELTHRGGRVVNPGRTRFYLLMSVAAAAAVVLGGVTVALLASDLGDPIEGAPAGAETAASSAPGATGGAGVSVDVVLRNADALKSRAYLVTETDATQLRDQRGPVAGIPLAVDETTGDVVRFKSLSAVPPGNYYLYVVDEEGRDNLDTLSAVRVPSLQAEAPPVLWRGLSTDARFALDRDGAPAAGTLLLVSDAGRELPTLPLENGKATLPAPTLDRLVPSTYTLQYAPNGSQFWITLDKRVEVREPLFALEPLYALEAAPTTFRATLAHGGDAVPPVPAPRIDGDAPLAWSPDADGRGLHATFALAQRGSAEATLGRLAAREVHVVPDLRLRFAVDGNVTTLRVASPSGAPVAEAAIGLGTRVLDLTDADGALSFETPPDGPVELRVTLPDGAFVARGLRFEGGAVAEEPDLVRVRGVTAASSDGEVRANGTLLNEGVAAQRVTLALVVDGRTVATRAVEAPARAALDVALAAPVRLGPGEHAVNLVATTLRHAPIEGAAAREPPPPAASAGDGSAWDAAGLVDGDGGRHAGDAVTLTVASPTPMQPVEYVRLEPRADAAAAPAAGEAANASPAARVPGPAVALALAAVALAALLGRRRR
ncbi:MAG TPA: winged helix-turn-helix domain-containing protein [Candidatus Thermoplasmatota archaeon]|nr:winged helix-turn-helix domain-containing protein [Candidatus Thermoplasmatota archaeon]